MPPCAAARPKNASTTRETILRSARTRFLRESYDTVGLRDVAADAGVDVALVSRYLGGKEGLFRAVLSEVGCDKRIDIPEGDLAEALADAMLHKSEGGGDGANLDRLLISLRSLSSPHAAAVVRENFGCNVLEPLAESLHGEDRDTRAGLAMSCLMGSAVMAAMFASEPLEGEKRERLRRRAVNMLRAALAEG